MSKSILTSLVVSASLLTVQADIGPIDFETAGDLVNNFRLPYNGYLTSQTSLGGSFNNYIVHSNSPFNSNGATIGIYDLTPADGAATQNLFAGDLTVEFDISAGQAASSFGVLFIDPANQNNNLLALLNLDNNLATNETVRFFRDGGLPSAGTIAGAAVNGDGGLTVSPDSAPVWGHVVVGYTADNGSGVPQLTFTMGSFSATSLFSSEHALPSTVEVGFRIFDLNASAGNARLDNFQVTVVPEPGSAALMGMGLGAWLLARRQRRTA